MTLPIPAAAAAGAALSLAVLPAPAQTLYTIDAPAGAIFETTSPPAGACGYPNAIAPGFPAAAPFVCPTPGAAPAPPIGGIAIDRFTDTIFYTDGALIGAYTPAGAPTSVFGPPAGIFGGPLTGLALDSAAGVLYATDGAICAGMFPAFPPGCVAAAPATPPFPMPGFAVGIDFDPFLGVIWGIDPVGAVFNVVPGGGPGPIPFFMEGNLPGPYEGIAVNVATLAPGVGDLFVTDGAGIAHILPGPAAGPAPFAAPTFYAPLPFWPTPVPSHGLAMAGRAITYGAPSGATAPTIGGIGQSITPNPAFAVTVTGGLAPGDLAYFYLGFGALCPPFAAPPTLYLTVPPFGPPPILFGGCVAGPGGACAAPVPLPIPAFVTGAGLTVQAFVITAAGGVSATEGLYLTTTAP
jgi:hypothetical protein